MANDGQPGRDRKAEAASELSGPIKDGRGLLQVGADYGGRITGREVGGTYTVQTFTPRANVAGCQPFSQVCSGMLGFRGSGVLPVGTEVKIVYGRPPLIIGVTDSSAPDPQNGDNRSALWGDPVSDAGTAGTQSGGDVAEDLLEGELEIRNAFGVAFQFLTHIASLKAGDRAKVETHLLNDMVRIISQQFRHISCMGEETSYDHGRPTLERTWSSYRHEVMGKLKEKDPLFELKGDEIDKETIDRVNDLGRHRLIEYIGFVGDFIHSFIADPPAALVKLHEEATGLQSGKSLVHRGSDGTVLTQSVTEIRSEIVTRIPVPYRKASHEDPQVTRNRSFAALEKDYLRMWDYGKPEDKSAYRTAYQLREYARYLTRFQAFARALQLDSEFVVPSEGATPIPDRNNGEEDRAVVNGPQEYFEVYSVIAQMRDGSIVIHDGYGSSAVFSNGNVQISAARHLELEAAGDIRIVAGGSLYAKARRNIEFSASAGGMILHSFSVMKAFCERGSVWLKSAAKATNTAPKYSGAPDPEILPHGVYIESTENGVGIRAAGQLALVSDAVPADSEDRNDTAGVLISARGNIRIKADGFLVLAALKDLVHTARRAMVTSAARWYAKHSEVDLGGGIYMRPSAGLIQATSVDVQRLRATSSIASPKMGPTTDPDSRPPVGPHYNHVRVLNKPEDLKFGKGEDSKTLATLAFAGDEAYDNATPWESQQDGPRWQFFGPSEYYWDTREETPGGLVQTLTQQHITYDAPNYWGDTGSPYEIWNWRTDRLQTAKRNGDYILGFGGGARQYRASTGDNLHEASNKDPEQFGSPTRTWTAMDVTSFQILKRS